MSIIPTSGSISFIRSEVKQNSPTDFQQIDQGIYYFKSDGSGLKKAVNFDPKDSNISHSLTFSPSSKYLIWARGDALEFAKTDGSQKQTSQINFAKWGRVFGGYSVSPDETKIAVVTRPKTSPTSKENADIFLTVLNLNNPESKIELKVGTLTYLYPDNLNNPPECLDNNNQVSLSQEHDHDKLTIFTLG